MVTFCLAVWIVMSVCCVSNVCRVGGRKRLISKAIVVPKSTNFTPTLKADCSYQTGGSRRVEPQQSFEIAVQTVTPCVHLKSDDKHLDIEDNRYLSNHSKNQDLR